jgi:hypothetical protein
MAVVLAPTIRAGLETGTPTVAAGTDWQSPTRISNSDAVYDARSPALAVSGATVHVVWAEDHGGDGVWLYHRYGDGTTWSPAWFIVLGESPTLAVGPDGNVHLVYTSELGGNFEIFYQRWDGSRWTDPRKVSYTTGSSVYPAIAIAADGTRYVAWADNSTVPGAGESVIYFAWSPDDAHWAAGPVPSGDGTWPQLEVDSQGRVHLAWQDAEQPTEPPEVYYSRCDQTPQCLTWTLPENVSDSATLDSRLPRLALGRDDSAHLVWEEGTEPDIKVLYSTRRESAWEYPGELSRPGVRSVLPSLVIDGLGNRHVAWDETNDILSRMWSGGTWGPTGRVASNANGVTDPVVSYGPGPALHAAWAQGNTGGRWEVYYSSRLLATYRLFLPFLAR